MNNEKIIDIGNYRNFCETDGSSALKSRVDLKEDNEILFFDANKEVDFLKKIDRKSRYIALGQELKTAAQELFFVQGGALDRFLDDGKVKDSSTGTPVENWVTDNSLDMVAFNKIQNGLNEGKNLVIHFSPRNVDLGYDCNIVDFWINKQEDGKIKFLRFFVNDDFEKMKLIYLHFGGDEEINSRSDLLTNPLITDDFKMADIMANLKTSDKKIETSKDRIDNVVDEIMNDFYQDFGNEIFNDDELIDRIYSAVVDVVCNGEKLSNVKVSRLIKRKIDVYMYAPIIEMRIRENMGGACPGVVKTAEFGSAKMMVVKENGSLVFKPVENTDNLTECKACGYWYSGEKCPLCG